MSPRTAITTTEAPPPAASYSQGVRKGPLLQVSGQGSFDPATREFCFPGDVKAQTERTLRNVEAILTAGGATFDDVIMLRVFLTNRDDFAAMNDVYAEFVGTRLRSDILPARTTVITGLPQAEMLIEIDALAVLA